MTDLTMTRRVANAGIMLAAVLWTATAGAADTPKAALETEAPSIETAALTPDAGGAAEISLPTILGDADVALYRRIFSLQKKGDWKAADALVGKLESRLLLGHVQAQRYLHPTKYRSRYKELKDWMGAYADHPDARRLYKLALRRRPNNWRGPKAPVGGFVSGYVYAGPARTPPVPRKKGLTRSQRRDASTLRQRIRWYLRKGWTLAVKKMLKDEKFKRLLSTAQYDQAKARLGAGYFAAGRDEWALQWAGDAARRSGRYMPEAHWTAGLAAWRLGRLEIAHDHFRAIAEMRDVSRWLVSAAAFWAARVDLVSRRPAAVNRWLGVAAAYPRTLYGLLARHMLGLPMVFSWTKPRLEINALAALAATDGGRRTLALLQVDERRRAERELRLLAAKAEPRLAHGILALAGRAGMPALAMRLDGWLFPNGGGYDGAAYPLADWQPKNGFRVDRALIHALVRQESGFNPKAKSGAGARGLMQLMPRTASFVGRDRRLRGSKRRVLYQPSVNLELGQKYIEMLLANDRIDGNLFLLATAWNGGPGNLNKWRRETKHLDDPLFFIESLPSRETRIFIERVLTNLWIYRHRLGQATPSLEAIAAGEWPVYTALDKATTEVAQDGKDRGRKAVPAR